MAEPILDLVTRETGRIMPDLMERRVFGVSPWMSLIPRAEYPAGLGEVITDLLYERSAPTEAEPTWSTPAIVDGQEGGTCLPPTTEVPVASTTRNWFLQKRALNGPKFCAEDLRPTFSLGQQLEDINGVLLEYVKIEWEIKDRHDYFRGCKYKVVVNSCTYDSTAHTDTQATTYPATAATGLLPIGLLEDCYIMAIRDGATGSGMMSDGGPLLTVITSPETARNILDRDTNLREDLREAGPKDMANLLFRRLGVRFSFKDFVFIKDIYNRRFSYSGGYTEIPVFTQTTAASKGLKAEINSSWRSAVYEESFIFDSAVFTQLIPRPITNPAPNFVFDPVNYTGIWKVLNIPHELDNPDGNIIRHRCIMAAAARARKPERGFAFVHLRCPPECTLLTSCS